MMDPTSPSSSMPIFKTYQEGPRFVVVANVIFPHAVWRTHFVSLPCRHAPGGRPAASERG